MKVSIKRVLCLIVLFVISTQSYGMKYLWKAGHTLSGVWEEPVLHEFKRIQMLESSAEKLKEFKKFPHFVKKQGSYKVENMWKKKAVQEVNGIKADQDSIKIEKITTLEKLGYWMIEKEDLIGKEGIQQLLSIATFMGDISGGESVQIKKIEVLHKLGHTTMVKTGKKGVTTFQQILKNFKNIEDKGVVGDKKREVLQFFTQKIMGIASSRKTLGDFKFGKNLKGESYLQGSFYNSISDYRFHTFNEKKRVETSNALLTEILGALLRVGLDEKGVGLLVDLIYFIAVSISKVSDEQKESLILQMLPFINKGSIDAKNKIDKYRDVWSNLNYSQIKKLVRMRLFQKISEEVELVAGEDFQRKLNTLKDFGVNALNVKVYGELDREEKKRLLIGVLEKIDVLSEKNFVQKFNFFKGLLWGIKSIDSNDDLMIALFNKIVDLTSKIDSSGIEVNKLEFFESLFECFGKKKDLLIDEPDNQKQIAMKILSLIGEIVSDSKLIQEKKYRILINFLRGLKTSTYVGFERTSFFDVLIRPALIQEVEKLIGVIPFVKAAQDEQKRKKLEARLKREREEALEKERQTVLNNVKSLDPKKQAQGLLWFTDRVSGGKEVDNAIRAIELIASKEVDNSIVSGLVNLCRILGKGTKEESFFRNVFRLIKILKSKKEEDFDEELEYLYEALRFFEPKDEEMKDFASFHFHMMVRFCKGAVSEAFANFAKNAAKAIIPSLSEKEVLLFVEDLIKLLPKNADKEVRRRILGVMLEVLTFIDNEIKKKTRIKSFINSMLREVAKLHDSPDQKTLFDQFIQVLEGEELFPLIRYLFMFSRNKEIEEKDRTFLFDSLLSFFARIENQEIKKMITCKTFLNTEDFEQKGKKGLYEKILTEIEKALAEGVANKESVEKISLEVLRLLIEKIKSLAPEDRLLLLKRILEVLKKIQEKVLNENKLKLFELVRKQFVLLSEEDKKLFEKELFSFIDTLGKTREGIRSRLILELELHEVFDESKIDLLNQVVEWLKDDQVPVKDKLENFSLVIIGVIKISKKDLKQQILSPLCNVGVGFLSKIKNVSKEDERHLREIFEALVLLFEQGFNETLDVMKKISELLSEDEKIKAFLQNVATKASDVKEAGKKLAEDIKPKPTPTQFDPVKRAKEREEAMARAVKERQEAIAKATEERQKKKQILEDQDKVLQLLNDFEKAWGALEVGEAQKQLDKIWEGVTALDLKAKQEEYKTAFEGQEVKTKKEELVKKRETIQKAITEKAKEQIDALLKDLNLKKIESLDASEIEMLLKRAEELQHKFGELGFLKELKEIQRIMKAFQDALNSFAAKSEQFEQNVKDGDENVPEKVAMKVMLDNKEITLGKNEIESYLDALDKAIKEIALKEAAGEMKNELVEKLKREAEEIGKYSRRQYAKFELLKKLGREQEGRDELLSEVTAKLGRTKTILSIFEGKQGEPKAKDLSIKVKEVQSLVVKELQKSTVAPEKIEKVAADVGVKLEAVKATKITTVSEGADVLIKSLEGLIKSFDGLGDGLGATAKAVTS